MSFAANHYHNKTELLQNIDQLSVMFSFKNKQHIIQAIHNFNLEKEQELLKKFDIKLLSTLSDQYPPLLRELADPPVLLFYKGNLDLITKDQLAIVGPRKPSHYGKQAATYFANELSRHFVITSGAAAGIDSIAHQVCIDNNSPTIAVVGTGLDSFFPIQQKKLQQTIARKGLLLSEFPLGSKALPFHFPQRNRLITGLSKGVLVCEASKKSGSLISANFAIDQNRDVFAIPGSIFSPTSTGTLQLIQDGAKCATSADDILVEYGLTDKFSKKPTTVINTPEKVKSTTYFSREEEQLINQLNTYPKPLDTIIKETQLSIHTLLPLLTKLRLAGHIQEHPEQTYSL